MSRTAAIRLSMREIFDNIERAVAFRDAINKELDQLEADCFAKQRLESGALPSHSAGKLAPSPSSPVAAGPPYPNCPMPGACTVRGVCLKDPNCCE